ncbi:DeoR faimly transcriptional regulator [Robbsia andropogonis]|uniref:DeoR faimly transcriptional regulator n=1 Tax=Robbsia andropogonis TaxID=28092 RepID=A0A0F5K022_9BURK|nr:DeoR/GlpR family DNA-binding transcription regulator [Robbsia andropogonis]KKB63481.1 DeoR faimly transcriptional regulator [Robbsia andropogonis]MCP1120416.1 DeoR/GlpR family DNA-binding transcription regulator [Robbsia andropogonis]MCP1130230.1 DeoR/GlpR family DNA-binding transcription regulator [Robbsia andropogonis]
MAEHRHDEILSQLRNTGRVSVTLTAKMLRVSEETVRRDLKELEHIGKLRRIHGGAVPPRLDQDRPVVERGKVNSRGKSRIGELADGLIEDGMSIFLDSSTTTMAFARRLVGRNLTITTNCVDIALLLGPSVSRLNLTPGTLRSKDNALVGYETLAYTRRYFFDAVFMGIAACDLEHGWMDYEEHESVLRGVLRAQARTPVLLVDIEKFGRQANLNTFPLREALTVVCDRRPPVAFTEVFDQHPVKLIHP